MQLEFATFAELAETGAHADKVGSCDGYPKAHRGF